MREKIGYLVKRAQQIFRIRMDEALRPISLTTAQYVALNALEKTPDASNAALARACFVTPQTMIEINKGLEISGFITRHEHPQHGRIIQATLTPLGKYKLETAHSLVNHINSQMVSNLTEDEQMHLTDLLEKCCENLERLPG